MHILIMWCKLYKRAIQIYTITLLSFVDCFQDIIEEKFENCECTCNFFFCFSVKLGSMSGELRETLHLGQEKLSVCPEKQNVRLIRIISH